MSSIQLLVFGAALLAVAYSACPSGWRSYGGNCYMFQLEKQNWVDARTMCKWHKSDLMSIETAEEQAWFLKESLTFNHTGITDAFWLGATDWDMDKIFTWEPTSAVMSYKAWGQNPLFSEPNNRNGSEHCVAGSKFFDYKWSDEFCILELQYVCEMKDPGTPIVG